MLIINLSKVTMNKNFYKAIKYIANATLGGVGSYKFYDRYRQSQDQQEKIKSTERMQQEQIKSTERIQLQQVESNERIQIKQIEFQQEQINSTERIQMKQIEFQQEKTKPTSKWWF